jgi:hypothetical protein
MTAARHRALLDAYLTTRYVAYDGDLTVECRPGEHAAAMDVLLERHGAAGGVFITAWNPRSVAQSDTANAAAHRRLAAEIARLGLRGLPHRGFGADPAWQPEEGLFVLDLAIPPALALATRFGQNAIAAVARGRPAEVLRTVLMPEPAAE